MDAKNQLYFWQKKKIVKLFIFIKRSAKMLIVDQIMSIFS